MKTEAEGLVPLTYPASEFEAGVIVAALEAEGIEAKHFSGMKMLIGSATPALSSANPVMVRAEDLERAKAALERNRADSVDIDWSEVDVGEEPADAGRKPGALTRQVLIVFAIVVLLGFLFVIVIGQGSWSLPLP